MARGGNNRLQLLGKGAAAITIKFPKLYRLVKQGNFPEEFQTLCMNHQLKKQILHIRSKQT